MNKTEIIKFRVTPEEKVQIWENAFSSYRQPSEYLREVALQKPIINMNGFDDMSTELLDTSHTGKNRRPRLMAKPSILVGV